MFNCAEVVQWESGKSVNAIAAAQGIRVRRRCRPSYPSEGIGADRVVPRTSSSRSSGTRRSRSRSERPGRRSTGWPSPRGARRCPGTSPWPSAPRTAATEGSPRTSPRSRRRRPPGDSAGTTSTRSRSRKPT
uniref:Uncharacterized protein n=1 Tax=Setaria viridis TaxID=4556 RepID=A0A4U6T0U0_SETVI|nr:hypothetical protein SEVIR_9G282425v2 [Setaria viridis]